MQLAQFALQQIVQYCHVPAVARRHIGGAADAVGIESVGRSAFWQENEAPLGRQSNPKVNVLGLTKMIGEADLAVAVCGPVDGDDRGMRRTTVDKHLGRMLVDRGLAAGKRSSERAALAVMVP